MGREALVLEYRLLPKEGGTRRSLAEDEKAKGEGGCISGMLRSDVFERKKKKVRSAEGVSERES